MTASPGTSKSSRAPRAAAPAVVRYRRRRESGEPMKVVSSSALMWFFVVLYAFPVVWFVLSAFKSRGELFSYPLTLFPRRWTVSGFVEAWTSFDFSQYFLNTIVVAVVTTVLSVLASAATGYALAKYDAWWLRAFFLCILATTMLPTEVILSPTFIVIRDLGLYNSLAGLVIPSIITATGVFMFRQFFLTVPNELVEAARIDGAGELSIFTRIMLPIAQPIMVTLAIFSFQWRWNDYIWPLIVINDPERYTIQIALQSIVGAENVDWTVLLGASVISIVPLVLLFLVFQRYVVNADMNAGLKE